MIGTYTPIGISFSLLPRVRRLLSGTCSTFGACCCYQSIVRVIPSSTPSVVFLDGTYVCRCGIPVLQLIHAQRSLLVRAAIIWLCRPHLGNSPSRQTIQVCASARCAAWPSAPVTATRLYFMTGDTITLRFRFDYFSPGFPSVVMRLYPPHEFPSARPAALTSSTRPISIHRAHASICSSATEDGTLRVSASQFLAICFAP